MGMWKGIALLGALALTMLAQEQKPLVIILIGPPASGKSTQAQLLEKKYGLPVISDDQLREDARRAQTDPVEGMNTALAERLKKVDPKRGFILDGYPENRSQAEFLRRLVQTGGLPNPLVVQIDVKDEVARQRAIKQKANLKQFEAKLHEYQEELATARLAYPQADIWTINGERNPQQVQETIRSLISERMQ